MCVLSHRLVLSFLPIRAVHPDPETDPPVPTVRADPITGRPDAGDGSAAGLYSLNPKTASRLAGLRLRNRYLTDPTVSDQKIAPFLSDLLRSGLNSKENRPFSVRPRRLRRDLVEIRPDLLEICRDLIEIQPYLAEIGLISSRSAEISSRSDRVSPYSATFGKIRQIFTQPKTDRGPI